MTIRIDGTNTAANPGITGTDTDTGLQFGTDEVNIVTGGSTRATVDSSGRVGIGTTTPGNYDAAGDDLVISGSGEAGITVVSGTSGGGNIYFADGTTGNEQYRGWITYSHNVDALRFGTTGTERARITSDGEFRFNSGYGSVATAYGCRAWVRFNGDGTPARLGNGNVSSITDRAVGKYTVNFTTSMPDVNYCLTGATSTAANTDPNHIYRDNAISQATGSIGVNTARAQDGAHQDARDVYVAIFR